MPFNPMIGGSQGLGMAAQGGQPDIDPATINALLQQFGGMSVPGQAKPQGPFENASWMSRAPGVAHGLDNALIAMANMGPTGRTAGENISNVARGVQSIGPTRNAQAAAQYMLPLQMAGEVAKLQTAQGTVARDAAMAKFYGTRNDTTLEGKQLDAISRGHVADIRAQASEDNRRLTMMKGPMLMKDPVSGRPVVGFPDLDENGQEIYRPNKDIDVDAFIKQQAKAHVMGMFGNSLEGGLIQHTLGMPPDPSDPDSPKNAKYWKNGMALYRQIHMEGPMYNQGQQNTRQNLGFDEQEKQRGNEAWNKFSTTQMGQFTNEHAAAEGKNLDLRAMQIMNDPSHSAHDDPIKARQAARAEASIRLNKLQAASSEYENLPPDQQRAIGGPQGYFKSKGYDPGTRDFHKSPAAQAPQPNVMGVTPQSAPNDPTAGYSDGVRKFLQLMQNPK